MKPIRFGSYRFVPCGRSEDRLTVNYKEQHFAFDSRILISRRLATWRVHFDADVEGRSAIKALTALRDELSAVLEGMKEGEE